MSTINILLPDEMQAWVEDEVKAGGFSSASDYFRQLVREAKARKELEKQLAAGLESGEAQTATPQWWDKLHDEVKREDEIRREQATAL